MKIIWWLGLSIVSGILYRLGGTSAGTKWRDCGCPLVFLICLWLLKGLNLGFWWVYLLTFGLMWGSMTTYWKKKGTDAKWWNWTLTGLFYGLSAFPLIWIGIHGDLILSRSIFLAITIMWLREKTGKDYLEELGSGFLFCASIPILLI